MHSRHVKPRRKIAHSKGGSLRHELFECFFLPFLYQSFFSLSLSVSSSADLIPTMTDLYESTQSSHLSFPLLRDNNFVPWRQRISDKLKEWDLWWIVLGREVAPDKDSTDAVVQVTYNKHLRKYFWITGKNQNAMDLRISAEYTSATYDEDPKSL